METQKSWMPLLAIAVVGAGLGGGLWWKFAPGRTVEFPADALVKVQRGDLEVVVAQTGRIQPLTKVDVKSKVAGQVNALRVKEGELVRKGQVLLELDPRDFKRRLAEVEADRAMIRAELDGLLAGSRREDLAEARAMLAQAQARAKRAESERARASQALAAGSSTPREWEIALAEAEESAAAVRAAESKLARLSAGARPQEIAQARARLAKADVALAGAKDQLAYSVIRSPIAGTVIRRGIQEGEMVTPGVAETGDRKPLLTVADLGQLVVESEINQVDVGKLGVGQAVEIRVDTLPGELFKGQVYKVAPAAVAGREKDVQLFPVQTLVTAGEKGHLRPGMSADLDIFIQRRPQVLLLPVEAIVRERGLSGHVTVLKRDSKNHPVKERRTVVLGASSDHQTEIVSGLKEGEQVLIDPASAKDVVNQF